ncbi:DUF1206 domain-containing protein [Erythrobacteraceae bacterium CFH 75059]|uniref:DUF1206 domain-containing protein n=1 Tax=Qipengyuania thermophila TaxID=2509361 RepID=UPI00101F6FF0|nr:DUF1206 domain-containing protein [Qipengyuania thermophila]TCD05149.1 DUF1206 domain-containing protein [Erythrobacteraceae bacterium CFH 75059]
MKRSGTRFEALVRAGFFARAVLYIVLGGIALFSARHIAQGTDGIFAAIEEAPLGRPLLLLLVVGLVGYALFRLASPFFDIENSGSDAKGWAKRLGHLGSAVGHFALAYTAWTFASGSGTDGNGAADAAATASSMPLGNTAIGVLGLAFFGAAAAQAREAMTGSFMQFVAGDAPRHTRVFGAIGYAARTIVFVIIGWSLVRIGFMDAGTSEVLTLGEALRSLSGIDIAFVALALGLMVFGVFSLILARYRIVPDLDTDRLPRPGKQAD